MPLFGQKKCAVYSWNTESKQYNLEKQSTFYKSYLDSLALQGFHTLRIDSSSHAIGGCKVFIKKGKLYTNRIKNYRSLEPTLALEKSIRDIKDSLIETNQPFNKVTLIPEYLSEDSLIYNVRIKKDSIKRKIGLRFIGYSKLPKGYKKKLVKSLNKLDSKSIKNLEDNITSNPTLSLLGPTKISYTIDSTILYVYTRKSKQNNFNGFIGFGSNEKNEIQLNGQLNLDLNNVLNKLESIEIDWRGSEGNTQKLKLHTYFPYLLFQEIGLQSNLDLHKLDSTSLQYQLDTGLTYSFRPREYIALHYTLEGSTFYSKSQNNGSDYKKFGFGVSYTINNGGLSFNQNTFALQFQSNLLDKLYSGSNVRQTELSYNTHKQHRIWKDHFLSVDIQGENLWQPKSDFFQNELYQLGGLDNLRGFNQNSIFTSSYNMATIAYRYIPQESFVLEVFTDYAILKEYMNEGTFNLYSIGSGFQFRSKVGIFKMLYAIGFRNSQGIDFNNGKIHFGISTNF